MTPSLLPGSKLSDRCLKNVEQKCASAQTGRPRLHLSSTFLNGSHLSRNVDLNISR